MDFVSVHQGSDTSTLGGSDEAKSKEEKEKNLLPQPKPRSAPPPPPKFDEFKDAGLRSAYGTSKGLDAYARHKKFINDYIIFYGRQKDYLQPSRQYKTDYDVIREEYRFIRNDEDNDNSKFEKRLAKKYYDKLFKEYCLADLSLYKHAQIGLRWRTEKEVMNGKGQFVCGNKICLEQNALKSYEVNFAYVEAGERKNALVKLRLCPPDAEKLLYTRRKKDKKEKKRLRHESKRLATKKKKIAGEGEEGVAEREETEGGGSAEEELSDGEENGEEEAEEQEEEEDKEAKSKQQANPWKLKAEVEKTKEEEFEDYFQGLFP